MPRLTEACVYCFNQFLSSSDCALHSDIEALIPLLMQLMSNESTFVGASDVLQEIMTNSSFTYGVNIKSLTVPILNYLEVGGAAIVQRMLEVGEVGEIEHSLCKLLVAVGEHSSGYIASHIQTQRVKTFMRLLLSFSAMPGYYGVDEEESEMTLMFWCDLQETLWSTIDRADEAEDTYVDWAEAAGEVDMGEDGERTPHVPYFYDPGVAGPIYTELVQSFKRKVAWPPKEELVRWPKGRLRTCLFWCHRLMVC